MKCILQLLAQKENIKLFVNFNKTTNKLNYMIMMKTATIMIRKKDVNYVVNSVAGLNAIKP